MKRLCVKNIYVFLILPLFISLTGCAQLDNVKANFSFSASGDATISEDMLLSEGVGPAQTDEDDKTVPPPVVNDKNKVAVEDDKNKEETTPSAINLSKKNALLSIDAGGRTTPFIPYRERNLTYSAMDFGDLPLPPNSGSMDEMLTSLISAKVTGILYDELSPSAIINVLNDDYLVKPGDMVESFEIESISNDYVAIKTGSNIYRAKVGDIVDGELYGTGVYNLGHRFAGTNSPANDEDVLIVETKKKSSENVKKVPQNLNDLELPPAPELKIKTKKGEISLPVNGEVPGITQ